MREPHLGTGGFKAVPPLTGLGFDSGWGTINRTALTGLLNRKRAASTLVNLSLMQPCDWINHFMEKLYE